MDKSFRVAQSRIDNFAKEYAIIRRNQYLKTSSLVLQVYANQYRGI